MPYPPRRRRRDPMTFVIGAVAGDLTRDQNPAGESSLGDVVADAVETSSKAWSGNQASLLSTTELRGDLRADRGFGGRPRGTITYGDALSLLPANQGFTTIVLTGEQLRQALERQFDDARRRRPTMLAVSQGLHYAWDATRPSEARVDPVSISLGGKPVGPSASYRITVSDLLLRGGDGFDVFARGTPIPDGAGAGPVLDQLAAYLSTRNPLPVPTLDRITRLGA